MKPVNLQLEYADELLNLEGAMYWQSGKWKEIWDKEAKNRLRAFISDYLVKFPEGCFGLKEVAFFKLRCKTICVVIYSSPVEEKALISHTSFALTHEFSLES